MTARLTPSGGYVANTTTSRLLPEGSYLIAPPPSGNLFFQTVVGTLTLTSTIIKNVGKAIASATTPVSTIVKQTIKAARTGSITLSAGPVVSGLINVATVGSILLTSVLTDAVQYVRAYSSTIVLSGRFAKALTMFVSGVISATGAVFKRITKPAFTGILTVASTLDEMFFTPTNSNTLTRGMRWMRKFIGRR